MNLSNLFKANCKTYKTSDGFVFKYDPVTLLEYKTFRIRKIWILVSALVVLMMISLPIKSLVRLPKNFNVIGKYVPAFSEDALLDSLKEWNVYFPELVLKQMKLETGNFSSTLFKEANNLMGMTYPGKRVTTATGKYKIGKYTYAAYDNWVESAKDYAIFQKIFFTEKYYKLFLNNSNYAEDTSYAIKL